MEVNCYPFEETKTLQGFSLDYLSRSKSVTELYSDFPDKEGFKKQIAKRLIKGCADRAVLSKALKAQYASIQSSASVQENIEALNQEKTFTIVTGHQLNLMTGPLYFVHKIHSAIRLAQQLKEWFPAYHFVPVYWMATEDHDFEEINHFYHRGKRTVWQSDEHGAVGRFSTKELSHLLDHFANEFSVGEASDFVTLAKTAYALPTLTQATRYIVNTLFGEHGLVCVDGDDKALKRLVAPVFKQEMLQSVASEQTVQSNKHIINLGYQPQLKIQEINLFYLKDQLRERIEREGENYRVRNTGILFSQEELLQELKEHPERFSPNAALRPVYEEHILPNLAYIGGGAEVSYWLQLRSTFDALGVHYPAVVLRDSLVVLDTKHKQLRAKLNWSFSDCLGSLEGLEDKYIHQHKQPTSSIKETRSTIEEAMDKVVEEIKALDSTLVASAQAARTKQLKALEVLEKKEKRAWRKKHQVELQQVRKLHAMIYPNGVFQERKMNIVDLIDDHGTQVLKDLFALSNPLDFRLKVVEL